MARELTPSRRQASIRCARRRLYRAGASYVRGARRLPGLARLQRVIRALLALTIVSTTARAQDVQCGDESAREVRSLNFVGNNTFSDEELSARVITTPSSFARRYFKIVGAKRCYPDVGLKPDVDALVAFYRNNGFYETRVDTVVTPVSPRVVDVTFRINEGRPLILDSLSITGLDSVPNPADITRDLQLRVGGRFGLSLLASDEDTIISRLRNDGYPRATIFPASSTHPSERRAEVELPVTTGVRARIGNIAVQSVGVTGGKPAIDSAVVLSLLGFGAHQWYSDRALAAAQQNLYNLGAYRHVGISIDTTYSHGDTVADVIVDLREDYMRAVTLEEGWATLDCFRINGQYTDKNFMNEAKHLEVTARLSKLGYGAPTQSNVTKNLCYRPYLDADSIASSKVNDHFGATMSFPTLFSYHWVPAYTVYTERVGEYKAYLRSTDFGFGFTATRDIAHNTPLQLGYNLEHGQTSAEPAILCAVFNRCTLEEQAQVERREVLAVASAAIQHTTVDNLVDPTRGYNTAAEIRYSAPFLASDPTLEFFKATVDGSWYKQIWSRGVFAARIRAGHIAGGSTAEGTRLPPPQERLYAGGATSVRGFQQNEVGALVYLLDRTQIDSVPLPDSTFAYVSKSRAIPQRSVPVGGNNLLVLNSELRIRDPFFPELLEYVPFVDAGQVWTTQVGTARFTFNQLQVTPGLGLRYFSPVGAIQLNVGYNPYTNRAGPAYFAQAPTATTVQAPLICVTAPGVTPVPISSRGGVLVQDIAACPDSFVPNQSKNFFSHLTLTLSIGTDF